jgi:hypothetical protein
LPFLVGVQVKDPSGKAAVFRGDEGVRGFARVHIDEGVLEVGGSRGPDEFGDGADGVVVA